MAVAARREVVRQLQGLGLSERQALKLMGMSPTTLRYRPSGDGNAALRERLKELAGQHRRHGCLKLIPFRGHLILMEEGVRHADPEAPVSGGVSPTDGRTGAGWALADAAFA